MAAAIYTKCLSAAVKLKPDPDALPGIPTAENLINGLAAAVIVALLAGALFGLGQWGLGSHTNHTGQASAGKRRIGVCILGVFLVGALAAILNFALDAGRTVQR